MVLLEDFCEFLLLVHLFAMFVFVGAMTHNLPIVVNYLRGKFARQELEWLYVWVSLWAYVITCVVGALVYPAFRVALTKSLGVVVTVMIVICVSYMLYYEFDKWGIF